MKIKIIIKICLFLGMFFAVGNITTYAQDYTETNVYDPEYDFNGDGQLDDFEMDFYNIETNNGSMTDGMSGEEIIVYGSNNNTCTECACDHFYCVDEGQQPEEEDPVVEEDCPSGDYCECYGIGCDNNTGDSNTNTTPDNECSGSNREGDDCHCKDGYVEDTFFGTDDCLKNCYNAGMYVEVNGEQVWMVIEGGVEGVIVDGKCRALEREILVCGGLNRNPDNDCNCLDGYEADPNNTNNCIPVCNTGVRDINSNCCPNGLLGRDGKCDTENVCDKNSYRYDPSECTAVCPDENITFEIMDSSHPSRVATNGEKLYMVNSGGYRTASITAIMTPYLPDTGYPKWHTWNGDSITGNGDSAIYSGITSTSFAIQPGATCLDSDDGYIEIVDEDKRSGSLTFNLGDIVPAFKIDDPDYSTIFSFKGSVSGLTKNVDKFQNPNTDKYVKIDGSLSANFSTPPIKAFPVFGGVISVRLNLQVNAYANGIASFISDPSKQDPFTRNFDLALGMNIKATVSGVAGPDGICYVEVGGGYNINISMANTGLEYDTSSQNLDLVYDGANVTGSAVVFVKFSCGITGEWKYIPKTGRFSNDDGTPKSDPPKRINLGSLGI